MLRLKDVPPEEMSEVVRVAGELYARDEKTRTHDEERRHIVEAAGELGLPEEYLERAAAEVHQRRAEAIRERRARRRKMGIIAGATAVVIGAGWLLSPRPTPPVPKSPAIIESFDAGADRWVLNKNPETQATVSFPTVTSRGRVALLQVKSFGAGSAAEPFFANLDMAEGPLSLTGKREVTFQLRGKGLGQVRLDLQNGPLERWRSRTFPVSGEWRPARFRLDQFERQTRASPSAPWKVQSFRAPDTVQRVSFKVGHFINDRSASGEVAVDDLRFE